MFPKKVAEEMKNDHQKIYDFEANNDNRRDDDKLV